jgi:D-amino-acid oxidase
MTTALVLAETGDGQRYDVTILAETRGRGHRLHGRGGAVGVPARGMWPSRQRDRGGASQALVQSYKKFSDIATHHEEAGVRMTLAKFCSGLINHHRIERIKRDELKKDGTIGFEVPDDADKAFIKDQRTFNIIEGYKFNSLTIDTSEIHDVVAQAEMQEIEKTTGRKNVHFIKGRIIDAILNCTGMGAAELAGACMVPLRRALVKVPKKLLLENGEDPARARDRETQERAGHGLHRAPRGRGHVRRPGRARRA